MTLPRWMLAAMPIVCAGCSRVNSDVHLNEAMGLVEQHTGLRPEWTASWDAEPPVWDARSILSLDQAEMLALRNNRELRAELETIGQRNADLVQAGLISNPMLNFMIMFPSAGGRAMLRGNGTPMQSLQDLWLIHSRSEAARAELQEAILKAADQAVELAATVKKVYARIQYTQRAVELVRDNMNVVEQSMGVIRVRQSAGQATQVDLNLSRIRTLKLRSELMQMEAEHRSAQRELLMLMGLAAAGDAWKVEPVSEMSDPLEDPGEENALLTVAGEQRLDVKAAEWQAQAAAMHVKHMRHEALPEMSVGLGFERAAAPRSNNPTWAGRAGNIAARGLVDRATGMSSPIMLPPAFAPKLREMDWTVGPMLEMELPIFDQGQAQIAKSRHEYLQRRAEYEAKVLEVTRMVRESLVMYTQARDQVRFYRDAIVPEVERNLQLAQQSFVAGQESLTVFLQVQEDLIMTRLKILEYYRDYRVQRAELERHVGGRLRPAHAASQPAASEPAPVPATSGEARVEPEPAQPRVLMTCPMHPQVQRDTPGDCPICGMKLVPAKRAAK